MSVYVTGVYFQNGNPRAEGEKGAEKAKPVAAVKVAGSAAAAPRTFNPKKNSIGI